MNFTALVLAGNRSSSCEVAKLGNVSHKAFLPIAGIPMITRVIDTIASVSRIQQVGIVIEDADLLSSVDGLKKHLDSGYITTIAAKSSPAQSALHGVDQMTAWSGLPVVLTTADNCLMTPDIVNYFLDGLPENSDLTAALAVTEDVIRAYPDVRRTRLKFRDGQRSGCNLFACQTDGARRVIEFWRRIEQDRKNPLAMLKQLGYMTALRYASNKLSLPQALQQLERKTQTHLGIVEMNDPVAAIDVDTPEDFYLAERILFERAT